MSLAGTKMSSPYPFTPQEIALANEVAAFTMKVARPLIWHDVRESWPKRLLGGTCFILRFDAGLIGVTAEHVIEAFEKDAKKPGTKIVCLEQSTGSWSAFPGPATPPPAPCPLSRD